jgi:hypothetical protein
MRLDVCVIVDRWVFHFVNVVPASMLSSFHKGLFTPRTERNRIGQIWRFSQSIIAMLSHNVLHVLCVYMHGWYSVTMPSPDRSGSDVLLESQYSINLRYTRDTALFDAVACGLPTKGVTPPVQFTGFHSIYMYEGKHIESKYIRGVTMCQASLPTHSTMCFVYLSWCVYHAE